MVLQKTSPPKDKRESIIEAMLDLVVERGFHDAPMSLLAKRAGASAGVIYHYFASKDEVLQAVYEHVKSMKLQFMLEGQKFDVPFKQAYIQTYINAYNFYRTHQRETKFLDLYESSTYCTPSKAGEQSEMRPELVAFMKAFRPRSEGGVLKDLPISAIHEFSFGTARQLAKKDVNISSEDVVKVAHASWSAISDD
ncbi:MAG: TetR/AcrR family transcriptional regulator [Candidatus Obscuribacterales bacterium]